ncbi:MAG: NUDIX hydrolase [Bacteroidia bacterium]|nr:MAG: NUDIX hydrolase [Bacteroidia bacterium]
MYKIFFENRCIILTDCKENVMQENNEIVLFYPYSKKQELKTIIKLFDANPEIKKICIYSVELPKLLDKFLDYFKLVKAAGGLVKNENKEVLSIFRNNVWDLPKGHLEKNEKKKVGAIREVQEECGLDDLRIVRELPQTFHTYYMENKRILKITYWYEMLYKGNKIPRPQTKEGITKAEWVKVQDIKNVYKNTFASLNDILKYV